MAEPKGGPVKPPTLDLKPKHSRTSSANPKSNPSNQARTRTQHQANAQAKSIPDSARKPKLSSVSAAIIGVVGGALLALLLIIPLLMSGVFQPADQFEKNTEIDTRLDVISDIIQTNQEQTGQELVDYLDAMDKQVNVLRQNLNQELTLQGNQLQAQIDQVSSTQQNLLSQNNGLSEQNASLLTQFETAQANPPSNTRSFDTTKIEQRLTALSARLDAITADTSIPDAQKILGDFEQLQSQMQTLSQSLIANAQQAETAQQRVADQLLSQNQQINEITQLADQRLEMINQQTQSIQDLTATSQSTANDTEQPSTHFEILQPIPLQSSQAYKIQSDLNSAQLALANGQPFLLELQSLSTHLPNLHLSEKMQQVAAIGLPLPNEIISQFNLAIPDMLAVRPAEPRAGWISQIGNSVKSALAIRPTGLTNGDPIENMLNQTLAAVNRTDFYTAYALLKQLPTPMFEVIGDLANQIGQFGDSQNLINEIKQSLAQNPLPKEEPTNTNNVSEVTP